MYKKILTTALLLSIGCSAFAGFKEHMDLGQQYLASYQYSSAISEFKNALRINYLDNSARICLINAYMSRATHYANDDMNYQKAADDYRSALFYMQYYPQKNTSEQYIPHVTANLNTCLSKYGFDRSPENRFETAKQLRAEGNFAAAGYEFNQTLANRSLQKDSFEQVGDIMKMLGNTQKAAEYYRKAINVAPTDVKIRLNYATMLDSLGQEDAAVSEYNYILGKTNDSTILYSLERIYKKKLESNPENADLTSNLGAILQKLGKYDDALMYYSKSEYLNPSNVNTRLNVGTLYQQKGDYKTAMKAYESVLIIDPNNVMANLYRADTQAAMGNTKEAIESYKKVTMLDPANDQAKAQMLKLLQQTMPTSQFVEYVKKNMPDVNLSELYYNYGLDLHKQNKLHDAISMYNEALKIDSQNPEIYLNIGIAQNQMGESEKALTTLKAASLKFPDNKQLTDAITSVNNDIIDKHIEIAGAYYNKGDYKKAIEEYLKIEPATFEANLGIATCYQSLENRANAITYYQRALQMKPTDSDIAYYIGVLYAEDEDLENAKAYVNTALAINKNNEKAIEFMKAIDEQIAANTLNKAIELYDTENYDEALAIFNSILEKDSKNAYAFYYRGMIYDTKNKKWEAIKDFKAAYELNNEFEILIYLIAADYDSLGKYKEAVEYYTKYSASNAPDDEYKQYAKARIEELKEYAK